MKTYTLKFISSVTLTFLAAWLAAAQPQPSPAVKQADDLFQAQKWPEAAAAYETLTKTEPSNGRAWFRLGLSLHSAGEYGRAVAAFEQALKLQFQPVGAMVRAARAYAKLNQKEQALEWLRKAVAAGFAQPQVLSSDPDLAGLSEDSRFKEVLALAERAGKPCVYQPEYKQFDFWVGQWDVTAQGQSVGANSIERAAESCIVLENYTQPGGYSGKSINFFDASLGKWRQTWVDSAGNVGEYVGEYKDGAMRFEGESHRRNGQKVLLRMILFNLAADRVRQMSEASTDGGKTWNVTYDFIYVRKK